MVAANETGPDAGRYLVMPFETGMAGVQRVDLQNPHYRQRAVTIVAPGTQGFVSGDASRWTPWGGYLTAEDNDVLATGYNRPEDIELQTLADGTELLYFNTTDSDLDATGSTGTSRTYNINLSTTVVTLFASPETISVFRRPCLFAAARTSERHVSGEC